MTCADVCSPVCDVCIRMLAYGLSVCNVCMCMCVCVLCCHHIYTHTLPHTQQPTYCSHSHTHTYTHTHTYMYTHVYMTCTMYTDLSVTPGGKFNLPPGGCWPLGGKSGHQAVTAWYQAVNPLTTSQGPPPCPQKFAGPSAQRRGEITSLELCCLDFL